MSRIVLKFLNGIYGWIISTAILMTVVYAGYSIWDNSQIYAAAQNVQDQIRKLKPDKNAKDGPDFDELRALNGDVVGWITVNGTNIDYPILQGKTNSTYMNKDVYGKFSLAGSIFLDVRNKSDFSDPYSLIYGHNMDEHQMFGDLALFKDKDFFKKNTKATLMVPGQTRNLEVAAILQIPAGTEEIFNPDKWKDNLKGFGEFLKKNSIWYHKKWIETITKEPNHVQIDSLVTCSDGSTNDRTVLILVRKRHTADDDFLKDNKKPSDGSSSSGESSSNESSSSDTDEDGDSKGKNHLNSGADSNDVEGNGPKKTGDSQNPEFWVKMIAAILLFIAAFEGIDRYRSSRRD